MTEASSKRTTGRIRYTTRTLIYATTLSAWILGVHNWLGDPYGWLTAIPLTLSLPVCLVNPRTIGGGLIGFLIFAFVGELTLVGFEALDIRHWLAIATVGAYGFACGSSIHAFAGGQRLLGSIVCGASVVAFAIVLQY